jgi:hypothetical protein
LNETKADEMHTQKTYTVLGLNGMGIAELERNGMGIAELERNGIGIAEL